MRNRVYIGAFLALVLAVLPAAALAETYNVDAVHSSVHFRVRHLSASMFQGSFTGVSGTLVFDEAAPEKSSIEFEVKADSVVARNENLDNHIKSPDFLNAKQFPVITFKSTGVKKTGDKTFQVSGKFTLRGVTKDLTVDVEHIGASNMGQFGPRIGFSTSFTVNRRDFDVNYGNDAAVGDEVTLIVDLEGSAGGGE